MRVGDRGGGKGSLSRFWMNAESVWISSYCWSKYDSMHSFECREATPDGADNTAERLTSHPEKESDMDTLQALNQLEKTIEGQRHCLLQAHGVLTCLYKVLLHAECEEAVSYAQATYVARDLINKGAEEVDSVRITPLLDALAPSNKVGEPRVLYVS